MRISIRATFAFAAALTLAACSGKSEEPLAETQDNMVTEVPVDTVLPANAGDAALDPPVPTNVATPAAAPPPAFTDSQQMRDDADATGLTSRIPSDDAPRPAANETAPVAE